jgi:dienelactone hydrolase
MATAGTLVTRWEPGEHEADVEVAAGLAVLEGTLVVPATVRGVVLFAHGSGSSRRSPRNRSVARVLNEAGLATLLFDLLTAEEVAEDRRTAHLRFDVGLLTERLIGATDWIVQQPIFRGVAGSHAGYFGASTGAAAALCAAAERPGHIGAVVSRGGRPDLAGPALRQVQAPTLLIVGGADGPVIALNQDALAQLRGEKALEIVPGATHVFEEPGALETAARHARDWFVRYLAAGAGAPPAGGAPVGGPQPFGRRDPAIGHRSTSVTRR